MTELGEKVFNEVIQLNYPVVDLIKKTIDLMEETFANQFRDKIEERVEEIAMQRAKDINGIPVRTLIAKDILTTLISQHLVAEANNEDIAETVVDLADALLNKLKR